MKNALVVLAAALTACASPTDARRPVRVAAAHSVFDRASAPAVAFVPFSVTSGSATTVYLPACGGNVLPVLERQVGTAWTQYASFQCLAIFSSAPVALAPGATAQGGVSIAEPGRYRLRLSLSRTPSFHEVLTVVSPQFTVR